MTTIESWMPLIQQIVSILVLPLIAGLIYHYTGIKIEEKNMNALQTSLENAVGIRKTTGSVMAAQDYVKKTVPDAVAAFKLSDAAIGEKIQAKEAVMVVKATGNTTAKI